MGAPAYGEDEEWTSAKEEGVNGLSRSITYSSYSVREAALGAVVMPSVARNVNGKQAES